MSKIREKDRTAILNAIAGGVTPRQGIQHIQVGRKEETEAIIKDLEHVKNGGGAFRMLVSSYGSGKALTNDTPILTENGYRLMGEIKCGDRVYTRQGRLTSISHIFPQGKCDIYILTLENGQQIKCNKNHLWFAYRNGVEQIITTETLIEAGAANYSIPTIDNIDIQNIENTHEQQSFKEKLVAIKSINTTKQKAEMTCITVEDESSSYICADNVVTHNTFFLTLAKVCALKQNFAVITTDLAPDRRFYSTSGMALNLYRSSIRSLSTPLHPDGGALEEILNAIDEKVMSDDNSDFLSEIRKLPYGFDAISVCNKWHIANNPITEKEKRDAFILKDACLRWFSGEATHDNKKLLQVRSLIGDDGGWDMIKTLAMLCKFAGFSGLLVEYDEFVNIFKIANSQSRDKCYEVLLRMINETLQGDAPNTYVLIAATPPSVMDPRRGVFSYEAARSRLVSSEYTENTNASVDISGPLIDLLPLSNEDQLILLGNITNVFALGDKDKWLVNNDQMVKFLEKQTSTLGADTKTPREINRAFVMMLRMMEEDPTLTFESVLGDVEVEEERAKSGVGQALDNAKPNNSVINSVFDDDDDDFDF